MSKTERADKEETVMESEGRCRRCRNQNIFDCKCKLGLPAYPITDETECTWFKSRFIEYPLTIQGIVNECNRDEAYDMHKNHHGNLVKVKPCDEKYGGKTYLGILLGDLIQSAYVAFQHDDQKLHIGAMTNPAIFVPELKEIIWGSGSWWGEIESPEDLKEITTEEINNVWYVQLLKGMIKTKE